MQYQIYQPEEPLQQYPPMEPCQIKVYSEPLVGQPINSSQTVIQVPASQVVGPVPVFAANQVAP